MPESNPSTPKHDPSFSRRSFLRGLAGVGTGIAVGAVAPLINEQIAHGTTMLTGQPAGETYVNRTIQAECSGAPDSMSCVTEKVLDSANRRSATIWSPIVEELLFRGLPIAVADRGRGMPRLITGHGLEKPTRRQMIAGAISSVVFGMAHSVDFATGAPAMRSIPSPQIVDGALYYGLAYTFGLPASMVAHGVHNMVAIQELTHR